MTIGSRKFINFLFFTAAVAGGATIVFLNRFQGTYAMFYPTFIVAFYGLIVMSVQKSTTDIDVSDYYCESIYFLGFLFTLVSLATLFYRLGSGDIQTVLGGVEESRLETSSENEAAILSQSLKASEAMAMSMETIQGTFQYIGIAVTTSIAGVFLRNFVKARYIRNYEPETSDVDKSYKLLNEISTLLNTGFMESVGSISSYMDERKDLAGNIQKKEEEYIKGLDEFIQTIQVFSQRLGTTGDDLSANREKMSSELSKQLDAISKTDTGLTHLVRKLDEMSKGIEALQLNRMSDDMDRLNTKVSDFSKVADALIDYTNKRVDIMRRTL